MAPPGHAARIAQAVAYAREQRQVRLQAARTPAPVPPIRPTKARLVTAKPARLVPIKPHGDPNGGAPGEGSRRSKQQKLELEQKQKHLLDTKRALEAQREQGTRSTATHSVPAELEEQFRAEYRAARGDFAPLARALARPAPPEREEEAVRQMYQAQVQSRRPAWWPREMKAVPYQRPRPPPSPTTVAAANARLGEIRQKLELGHQLTANEESDASAILQLKEIWAEGAAATAAPERSTPFKSPLIGHHGLALPSLPRLGRDLGLEAASCLTFG
jgi:hypothetical protein